MWNDKGNDQRLRKDEIIRGYESYSSILSSSTHLHSRYLKAFLSLEMPAYNVKDSSKDTGSGSLENFSASPSITNVKAGFIVARKKINTAVKRNRIKRLFRELYRLNKHKLEIPGGYTAKIIFSLNEPGYNLFTDNNDIKLVSLEDSMTELIEKINNHIRRLVK